MKVHSILAGLIFATALWVVAPGACMADQHDEASNQDAKCLKCHTKNLKKKLEDGEKLSLKIAASDFEESVHGAIGCTGCHQDIGESKHPTKKPIASQRVYAEAQNEACGRCHVEKSHSYAGSIHATLVKGGDANAPLCSDCHKAHAVKPMAVYEPVTGEPCKACHEPIFQAYSESVHGMARTNGNVIRDEHIQAPVCADCHSAHAVNAVAAVEHLQSTCLACHDGAADAHQEWLPNASMHMTSVSCAACHAPAAERRVDLQLYDQLEQVAVGQNEDHSAIQDRLNEIDSGNDSLDSMELWKLVRLGSGEGQPSDVILKGRLEVTLGVDAHRLAPRSEAVRSCETCHQGNAEAFQHVTVSIAQPDGRKQRFEADSAVLSSPISVDSISRFYAPGSTRIKLLDGILVLAVIGGLAIPAGHITLGAILRRKNNGEKK